MWPYGVSVGRRHTQSQRTTLGATLLNVPTRSFKICRVLGPLVVSCTVGCGTHPPRSEPPSIGTTAHAETILKEESDPTENLPSVDTHPELMSLPVTGYGNAIVSVPSESRDARPVLVAAHGAGGRPAWQCEVWGGIVNHRGFVLCPQGTRMNRDPRQGFFYRHHHALEKEVLTALEALRERFGQRVADGPVVYVGFSQGATMGALMVVKHPHIFQRLVLVEGGEAEWDVPTATRFRQGGGQRVLLVCGRYACTQRARTSLEWLEKGGLNARVEYVVGGGHSYDHGIADRLHDTFDWVIAGDPRWSTP